MNEMKSGQATGLDGYPEECLNKCGMPVLEWVATVNFFIRGLYLWTGVVLV